MKRQINIPRQQSLVTPEVLNPFVHKIHINFLRKIQIVFMSLFVVPIRLLMIFLCLIIAWMLAKLALAFRHKDDMDKPLKGWRNMLRPVTVMFCQAVFVVGGFWITAKGKKASCKEGPVLALAPHSSFFDALVLIYLNLSNMVIKSSTYNIPLFGKTFESSSFPVFYGTYYEQLGRRNQWHFIFNLLSNAVNGIYFNCCLLNKGIGRACTRRIQTPIRYTGRIIAFFTGFYNIQVKGQPAESDEAPVTVCAPHCSFMDAFVIFYCTMIPSSVSRKENSKIPILGSLIQYTQPMYVQREDPNSRKTIMKEMTRRARTMGEWPHIILFPEGTCTNRTCLIGFKQGAFYPGVPVQPVCIRYLNSWDTYTWTWEGPGAFACFWLSLCQFHNRMEIEFLPVYKPSEEEKQNPPLFASNVRAIMAKCLGVPVTDHTFDDVRLMKKAAKLNLPKTAGLIEFQKLNSKLGINYDTMNSLLDEFSAISTKDKGAITLGEFAAYLHVPVSPALEEIFSLYDRNGSETIDFREYIIGLSLISQPVNNDDTIRLAFELFDNGNKGYITLDGLTEILVNAFGMENIDVQTLFQKIDKNHDDRITYDEFKSYAETKPEYAKLFMTYQELKAAQEQDTNGNGLSKLE